MTTINPEELKALERLRHQLYQLSNSIGQLRVDIEHSDPLPPCSSIQSSATLIAHNLKSLIDQVQSHQDFFAAAHVYPLPSFPGRTQENLLAQLLRKRYEPRVEDWIEEGRKAAASFEGGTNGSTNSETSTDFAELWDWAGPAANNVAKDIFLSYEEDDSDEDEEEEDDDGENVKMEDAGFEQSPSGAKAAEQPAKPMLPLEDICKFMYTGVEPKGAVKSARPA